MLLRGEHALVVVDIGRGRVVSERSLLSTGPDEPSPVFLFTVKRYIYRFAGTSAAQFLNYVYLENGGCKYSVITV